MTVVGARHFKLPRGAGDIDIATPRGAAPLAPREGGARRPDTSLSRPFAPKPGPATVAFLLGSLPRRCCCVTGVQALALIDLKIVLPGRCLLTAEPFCWGFWAFCITAIKASSGAGPPAPLLRPKGDGRTWLDADELQ